MYLKSIRAQGFKSFADKIDLVINPGITGIVGPNGSGKSNIVDAVRWVLGEQSVKSLRSGSSMTDCIFSGSDSREPSKRAMVALVFDNSDGYLKSDFKEVEIKRLVYSTGENEYYINNARVRLKDVTDLFIDSGAGSGAYNIISQGNVTDIVNSKPSERRNIFESAAGVVKYKKRKEEALKKLEKTEDNLVSVRLVIDELKKTVEPLQKQSIIAKKYLEIKKDLENIDIALIAQDITDLNLEHSRIQSEVNLLKEKLLTLQNSKLASHLETLKLECINLEEKANTKRNSLLKITENLSDKVGEKKLTLERQKYETNSSKISDNLLKLKSEELRLTKNIEAASRDVDDIEQSINGEREKISEVQNKLLVLKVKKSTSENTLNETSKKLFILQNKIEILENNIMSATSSPSSVRNIINNPRLKGVCGTVGKVINAPDKYAVSLDIALGASSNYIIVENEDVALEAIQFLKERKLGRATFYPLNIIKGKNVNSDVYNSIQGIKGFIGVLSDLVSYDNKYSNVIQNLLGSVLVVDTTRTLNVVARLIDYRYKIVSLDGEVSHIGGSITGGTSRKNSMLQEKGELNNLKIEEEKLKLTLESLQEENKQIIDAKEEAEERENVLNKYIILLNDELFNKKTTLSRLIDEHKNVVSELEGMENLQSNKLESVIVALIEEITALEKEKENTEKDLQKILDKKNKISDEIIMVEKEIRDSSNAYNTLNNELKTKEVTMGKLEVKLDNLLSDLNNEYSLTYEAALASYNLNLDSEIAREKVVSLKNELKKQGSVNLGSIEEYTRVNKRYEFLLNQKNDLESACEELNSIIKEMDEIMKEKFSSSFTSIQKEFGKIFKLMFKGGTGELVLSEPDDMLTTGVDIVAIPPGKKINSPTSLSGGEKALTAICLLFAMLEVRPSPFVILDEAEAALDEVNVDMFGSYLNSEKKKSQFIVITHKKKMMEYADSLYGITMQESGVSKIVSVKVES